MTIQEDILIIIAAVKIILMIQIILLKIQKIQNILIIIWVLMTKIGIVAATLFSDDEMKINSPRPSDIDYRDDEYQSDLDCYKSEYSQDDIHQSDICLIDDSEDEEFYRSEKGEETDDENFYNYKSIQIHIQIFELLMR
ncbi:MAG: hypothetical protein Ta2E_00820 [Mycoplasmoidaceae bacterium]|nr:MAG: hypothetical protein Ta2E_00820 [Mycoplasmoidaceae bacterium]